MKNANRTKEQLIKELEALHQRIVALEASQSEHKQDEERNHEKL